jgi:thiosulfate/3-mercaptopyruvate sulfurtransferase
VDHIIDLEWLKTRLDDPSIVIADCRFNLADPAEGKRKYQESHIPGAVYFDLERDLSDPVGQHGGRHPLPNPKQFAFKLGNSGIDHTKTVIVYDDQKGAMAARLWWLLRYHGHQNVAVLNGGFSEWVKKGLPVTAEISKRHSAQFVSNIHHDWIVPMAGVKNLPEGEPLIDSRAPNRYRGETEPIDAQAGHIPGAENWFWEENLRDGNWLSSGELKDRFHPLSKKARVTVYCGSGVTACANILAMTHAGLKNVRLYPGSWSDWVSYPDNPVETDTEK